MAAARAVDYVGAGTVEFLFSDGNFYFLEMNTRLQVEHPVTELTTNLDLVRLQLLVAMGLPLPPEALSPTRAGHAVEARLYAEDPRADFLPVTGSLHRVSFPDLDGLRVDSGVEDGSVVSVHYDPMLAKVVAWAPTRIEAAALLARGLEQARIHGSVTNRDLLVRILRHPEFIAGEIDTHFLSRHDPAALGASLPTNDQARRAAVAAALADQAGRRRDAAVLNTIPSGWRNVPSQMQESRFEGPHGQIDVHYRFEPTGALVVDGYESAHLVAVGFDEVGVELDRHMGWYAINRAGGALYVDGPGGLVRLVELARFPTTGVEDQPGSLRAPMPGTVIRVDVSAGDEVEEGQVLVVMEAMKMEHTLRAPHGGVVTEVDTAPGDQVVANAVLVVVGQS